MMKFMSPLTILFLVLLLQETLFSAMADKQFVLDTCKRTLNYKLCISILLPNPKSEKADFTDLALIVVDTVKDKGRKSLQQIDDLQKSRPELKAALNECAHVYTTVVDVNVPSTVEALNLGRPMFAEDGMADTAVESQVCEGSFSDIHQTSPITDTNKDMEDVANVARAIIRNLL